MRRLVLLLLAGVAVSALLRRRRAPEHVEVQFEDGSSLRLTGGPEAEDLLDDVYAILRAAA
jgi:hypothetical protein